MRYLSPSDNDGANDPVGFDGDLYVDLDGAGGVNFVLIAHPNTATESVILKVDDGTDVGYVTII